MASKTDFLKLTLPAFNEFIDSWGDTLNQNLEDIDDWMSSLHAALVTTGGTDNWSELTGNLSTLATRLAGAIDDDGNLIGTAALGAIEDANYRGNAFADATERLDSSDSELYEAGAPFTGTRNVAGVPAAGFPRTRIEDASAAQSRLLATNSAEFMLSPGAPFATAQGLVTGGSEPFISLPSLGEFQLGVSGAPAIFNIDGYLFRLRESLKVDYSVLSPSNNEWIWFYVDRDGYDTLGFAYSDPAGSPATKDLRKLRSGTSTGTKSGSTFTVTGETFDSAPYEVKAGDLLTILSETPPTSYVVASVDGPTQLTIEGVFRTSVGAANWEITDRSIPNIGAVIPTLNSTQSWARPDFVEGRAYIGRYQYNVGNLSNFMRGGVYDSGWSTINNTGDFPKIFTHSLGVIPSRVEMWVRQSESDPAYRPIVRRQIQVDNTPTLSTLLLPSMQPKLTEQLVTLYLVNDSLGNESLATDSAGSELTFPAELRFIAWR